VSNTPVVSVIVPYYNAASHIARCLDSLVAQTLPSIEVICVDDGSTDGSLRIVEGFVKRHPDLFMSVTKPNGGRSDARNFGLLHAHGTYIGFVDSDDRIDPEMYAKLVTSGHESGAELVVCDYAWTSTSVSDPQLVHEGDSSEYGRSLAENPRIFRYCHGSLCNKLFARPLFGTTDEFFPKGIDFEDLATVFLLLARANRIVKIDGPPLYFYLQGSENSIMSGYDERYLQLVDALRVLNRSFHNEGLFEQFQAELLRVNLLHLIFARYSDFFLQAERALTNRFIDLAFAHLDVEFPGWRRQGVADAFETHAGYAFVSTHRPLLKAYVAILSRRARG